MSDPRGFEPEQIDQNLPDDPAQDDTVLDDKCSDFATAYNKRDYERAKEIVEDLRELNFAAEAYALEAILHNMPIR